ncbi:MAG: SoxR reducing system RseC family protein [Flavobacteriales bacterium]|nr:SoxR reducing system RseC family protein [Flavobacteriia bacterium]NCP05870.1 SoxR reducing system RseC family protein [Flavobacteriales bacterium]PIV93218.1 MAG: Fis family transcriptional regulator [Flavobacteriaceae bacterium CG17_big_fil_post_rev_8_21_14_2_50_33_15]PIY12840.1 MAG: Fis family transcriptional regulator [Flavobacteriaceae bacterium CG_4_10_14_3_um_filter_33_47]PJB19999.1 MAG: Fis family transcriptional regulator [Flavobacteriaceae bacterium CG_4_9_14_3_um_filter_33_16]
MNSNLASKNSFIHSGVISKIKDDLVTVTLEQNIHCEACHAKGSCGISESENKEIEILNSIDSFKINEQVTVVLRKALGLKAVFWAYVFPFILMFGALLIASSFVKEWVAGLISLFVLIPYYLLLYFLKNMFKKIFEISVLKI